jgi:hypothetical protein
LKTIKHIDRTTLQQLRPLLQAHLKAFGDKHGLNFHQIGRISFLADSFSFKLSANVATPGLPTESKEAKDFKRFCGRFGLQPTDLNKTFTSRGTTYKIVGLKPNSYKFPVIGENDRGTRYKFMATDVLNTLDRAA